MRRLGLWLVVVLLAGATLLPSTALAKPINDGTDQSTGAATCKWTGYLGYTTTKGSRFANVGECMRYAQRGGVLWPVAPTLTLSVSQSEESPQFFVGRVTGSGLFPGWEASLEFRREDGSISGGTVGEVPMSGILDVTLLGTSCGAYFSVVAQSLAWDGGFIESTPVIVPC